MRPGVLRYRLLPLAVYLLAFFDGIPKETDQGKDACVDDGDDTNELAFVFFVLRVHSATPNRRWDV